MCQESKEWAIEFRNGGLLQDPDMVEKTSGPMVTAQRFASEAEAKEYMRKHDWVLSHGGKAIWVMEG